MVAKGVQLKKKVNSKVVSGCFEEDWGSILMDASKNLQDGLVRETENVERRKGEEISEIKRFIKGRCGEMTLDEMVRKITVNCDKMNDALSERGRNKLTDLREENDRIETREDSGVENWDVKEDDVSGRDRTESGPSFEQIENFISDIKQQMSRRDSGRVENSEVDVEDWSSEENLAGVNPLPVDCLLLLWDRWRGGLMG